MFPCCPTIPRREYPRPDRQRGRIEGVDWLNLNGPWQFRFDQHRAGVRDNWFAADSPEWGEQIIVPFCWESLAAWGEGDSASDEHYYSTRVFIDPLNITHENHRSAPRFEVGWYRRIVELPCQAPWQGKRVILTIGAADFSPTAGATAFISDTMKAAMCRLNLTSPTRLLNVLKANSNRL